MDNDVPNYVIQFMSAALAGDHTKILNLSQKYPHFDPNSTDFARTTVLIQVSQYGHKKCIATLQQCFPHINVNRQDFEGKTALMYAIIYAKPLIVNELYFHFSSTINPNIQDITGNTALMYASSNGYEQSIDTLFSCFGCHNLDVNQQDNLGSTALMWAASNNQGNCVAALARYFPQINPNIQNLDGQTALMRAVWHGNLEPLFEHFTSINVNLQDSNGRTALMAAVQFQSVESIQCLLSHVSCG